jgi:selenocysteine-specific elongation factor
MFGAVVQALASAGDIVAQGSWIRLPEHTSSLGGADASLWDRVRPLIEASPYRPQTAREMAEHLGQPVAKVRSVCKTLARMGELMEIASDRFFLPATVREMASMTQELASAAPDNTFTAAQFKDRAGCGRNVGIQVLEYFDRRGLTMRNGDARKVVKEPDSLFTSRS